MAIVRVDPDQPDQATLRHAAEVLVSGGLVAFPTETVYGLGAVAHDADAITRVFAVKGRPADNPLIIHIAEAGQLDKVAATVPPLAAVLAERLWPGPLTLVVDGAEHVRPAAAGLATVAVRMPDHPVALGLLAQTGLPVAAPSANRSGRPSPTLAAHVLADLGERVDLILDGGPCAVGVESTVVDARGPVPTILREGAITREQLEAILGVPANLSTGEGVPLSPGTRHRHYRPTCDVVIAPAGQAPALAASLTEQGRRVGLISVQPAGEPVVQIVRFDDADHLARILYDSLRQAERSGIDVVVVEAVAETGIGRAVMDRLGRAAG